MKIQRVYCTCHPETCCHFKYELVTNSGKSLKDSDDIRYLEKLMKELIDENKQY